MDLLLPDAFFTNFSLVLYHSSISCIRQQSPERSVSHLFQRAIDGHQPQAQGEGSWRLCGGQGSTDLAEEPAQHAQPQGLPPVAQGSLGWWRLTVVRTHPAPGAREMGVECLQAMTGKHAQQDHQVDHQQVGEFAFALFPAIVLGQQISHHLAGIDLLQAGHLDLLAQLVNDGQVRYLERHDRTPFWLLQQGFVLVCQNWSSFSPYLSGIARLGAPRRLLTSRQGRTGTGAGLTADEGVQARRQAGQSRGVRGLRRRCTVVRRAPPYEWEG